MASYRERSTGFKITTSSMSNDLIIIVEHCSIYYSNLKTFVNYCIMVLCVCLEVSSGKESGKEIVKPPGAKHRKDPRPMHRRHVFKATSFTR